MTTIKDIIAALIRCANFLRDTPSVAYHVAYLWIIMCFKYLNDCCLDSYHSKQQKHYSVLRIAEESSFQKLYEMRTGRNLGKLINTALRKIENDNPRQLAGVFSMVDYDSDNLGSGDRRDAVLRDLLEVFETLDLRPSQIEVKGSQVPAEVIGSAFEYLLSDFAGIAGRKTGSFYTPAAVSQIIACIINAQSGEKIYDPTCGPGSLLIKTAKHQNKNHVSVYGQEINASFVSMAKMNLLIHEIDSAHIACGDSLANPFFLDKDGSLMLFDAIVANMPFSRDKWAAGFFTGGETSRRNGREFKMKASMDKYHRFDWGVPPSVKGDWAFLLHMIASCSPHGRIAAVAPHGVLFRGSAEGLIRKRVIDENILDVVIGLPENVLFGIATPVCILILKKNRKNKDILFIDASKKDANGIPRYIKVKNQNILEEKNINDIVKAFQERKNIPQFAYVASISEVIENEYNLNIPNYINTFEDEEIINLDEIKQNIKKIKTEITRVETRLDTYLKELSL